MLHRLNDCNFGSQPRSDSSGAAEKPAPAGKKKQDPGPQL